MKLKIHGTKYKNDKVVEKDYFDLLDTSIEVGKEENNRLFRWVKLLHLDDDVGNLDSQIVTHARELGVDVEKVLFEKVHNESLSKDTRDSFQQVIDSQPSFNSIRIE